MEDNNMEDQAPEAVGRPWTGHAPFTVGTFPSIFGEALLEVGGNAVSDGELAVADIDLNTTLADDIGLDSLGMMEIVCYLEERFSVRLSTNVEGPLLTVKDAFQVLQPAVDPSRPVIRIQAP